MKKMILLAASFAAALISAAGGVVLLPQYNSTFYPTVLAAAKGVANPFLLQQNYLTLPGVTVSDSTLIYNGTRYGIGNTYLNPAAGYYVNHTQYSAYGIDTFSNIWPNQFPDILFNAADTSFHAQSDCVGYLTRLLSATGDTSATGNAYLNMIHNTHVTNQAPFAYTGYVATAYSFAVAFPVLTDTEAVGWKYVAGNVEPAVIDTYNHTLVNTLGTYTGMRRGGFAFSMPGDVLAFGYSPSSSSNGHIMVMETAPHLLDTTELSVYFPQQTLAQAQQLLQTRNIYSVSVFDCSGQKAHFSDSRVQTSGIGHGTLLILTDISDDAPTGFIFDSTQVTYHSLHMDTLGASVYAISVGRFVTSVPTSIAAISSKQSQLCVFPNPATDKLTILLPAGTGGRLQIFNAPGQLVFQQQAESKSVSPDISLWPRGVYFIRYEDNAGNPAALKWIKQ